MSAGARSRLRSRRRVVRWIVLAAAALIVVAGVLFVRDALSARDSFRAVMEDLPAAQDALLSGDVEGFDDLVGKLQDSTALARASTDGPIWWIAGKIPVVGGNAAALTLVAGVVDDIAVDVLPNLGSASAVLSDGGLQITDSRIDLEPVREAAVPIETAYATVVDADDRLQAFDASNLISEIADPYAQAAAELSELRAAVSTGRDLTVLLPPMLGAEEPRQYIVLAQTNAELRSTGGVPGAILLISADDGQITLERTATSSEIGPFSEPVVELRPDDLAMYGEGLGRFIQDVTMTPRFPVGAEIAAAMWGDSQGESVDGVIAVDPVALSFLLEEIGPVDVGGWTLDAGNVVDVLLSEIYLEHPDPDDADAMFAEVASAVLGRLLAGGTGGGDLLDAVTRATDERRMLVWSAHAAEQELLSTTVGGDFDDAASTVGIFLNDGTRSKLSYYLDTEVTLLASSCTAAGRVDTIEFRLTSNLSSDELSELPSYVTGVDLPEELLGTVRTNIALHSAVGGEVINITRDGTAIGGQFYDSNGRAVTVFTQDLAPGESVAYQMDFLASPDDITGVTDLWTTPTTRSPGLHQYDTTYCEALD